MQLPSLVRDELYVSICYMYLIFLYSFSFICFKSNTFRGCRFLPSSFFMVAIKILCLKTLTYNKKNSENDPVE